MTKNERGAALIVSLMAMLLLSALGLALMITTTTETKIAGNYTARRKRCTRPTPPLNERCRTS